MNTDLHGVWYCCDPDDVPFGWQDEWNEMNMGDTRQLPRPELLPGSPVDS